MQLCNIVFSNVNLKPSELQDNFYNRHGEANVLGHDVESLKAKPSVLNYDKFS